MFSNKPNPEIFKARYDHALEAISSGNRKDAILYLSKAIEAQMARVEAERDPSSLKELQETLKKVTDLHRDLVARPEGVLIWQGSPPSGKTSGGGTSINNSPQGGLEVSKFLMKDCTTTFDYIIGHEFAKRVFIERMIYPIKYLDIVPGRRSHPQLKFLLVGPPGTGKTELAIAASNELGAELYALSRRDIIKLCEDDPENKVKFLFDTLRSKGEQRGKPVVLFVDECSELLPKDPEGDAKTSMDNRVISAFQLQLSLLRARNREDKPPLLFIGTTAKPADIWTNMLDHFPKSILYTGSPPKQERNRMLQRYTTSCTLAGDVNFEEIADKTEGFSGRDLKVLCGRAHVEAIVQTIGTKSTPMITRETFLRQVSGYKLMTSAAEIYALNDWAAKYALRDGGAGDCGNC